MIKTQEILTPQMRDQNNKLLAKLCGFVEDNGYWRGAIDAPVRYSMVPDFYADNQTGAYWREKARLAILSLACESPFSEMTENRMRNGEWEVTIPFTIGSITAERYEDAHNAAILTALDELKATQPPTAQDGE